MQRRFRFSTVGLVGQALAASTLLSLALMTYAIAFKSGSYYVYLVWNLFLAVLPLVFAYLLVQLLRRHPWSSWTGIGLSILWLGFLPNSFYMVTDYIHLPEVAPEDLLFYVVLFTSFIASGLFFGYASLYLVHRELRKRLPPPTVIRSLFVILLLCSFAVYLGRDLRWNTWDVLFNPGGLLFDISERFLSPAGYGDMLETTGLFLLLISTMYFVIWRFMQAATASVTIEANETRSVSSHRRRR
jgi:uncharacterized membrane protein